MTTKKTRLTKPEVQDVEFKEVTNTGPTEKQKERRMKALELALTAAANPTFMLNGDTINRDLKGVLMLSEAFFLHGEGEDVVEMLKPKLPQPMTPLPKA